MKKRGLVLSVTAIAMAAGLMAGLSLIHIFGKLRKPASSL